MPSVICLFGFSSSTVVAMKELQASHIVIEQLRPCRHFHCRTWIFYWGRRTCQMGAAWEDLKFDEVCNFLERQWKSMSDFLGSLENFMITYLDWEDSRFWLDSDAISCTLTDFHGPSMHFQVQVHSETQIIKTCRVAARRGP